MLSVPVIAQRGYHNFRTDQAARGVRQLVGFVATDDREV